MNKKGAELSMNVIIISILVILVLVIVAAFFMFGMTGLSQKIQDVFEIGTAGTDISLAQQGCAQYCSQITPATDVKSSTFCTKSFKIDKDNDGSADKDDEGNYVKYFCTDNSKGESLGISCSDSSGNPIRC